MYRPSAQHPDEQPPRACRTPLPGLYQEEQQPHPLVRRSSSNYVSALQRQKEPQLQHLGLECQECLSYDTEESKRELQRHSISLDNEKSRDDLNVSYGKGASTAKTHLAAAADEDKTSERGADKVFHSNQDRSETDLSDYYPQTFEYADFKRRMSFHR